MTRRTRTVIECDKCRKQLESAKDGLIFHGHVTAPDSTTKPLIGAVDSSSVETALCWRCFNEMAPNPELTAIREERARAAQTVRTHVPEPEGYRDYLDNPDLYRPGSGPSGPLPPPELPHCVTTAKALCGVRGR